jgi:hypothetical protein
VEVDGRRVARALLYAFAVGVAAVTVVLFAAAVHENSRITSLRRHGVPVEVTVTKCLGALGGSGSNAAGYSCRGTFVLDGRSYTETIPGNTLLAPGTMIQLVAVEGDPGIMATFQQAESEHASWGVFILPTVLLVVLASLITAIAVRIRRNRMPAIRPRSAGESDSPTHRGSVHRGPATAALEVGFSGDSLS